MSVNDVIQNLNEFVSNNDGDEPFRLYEIFRGFRELPDREKALPAIFALMERYPDHELGTPGSLVHESEAIAGYESILRASVQIQPALLTLWMVNRILNTDLPEEARADWFFLLKQAAVHPRANEIIRDQAERFLEFQAGK